MPGPTPTEIARETVTRLTARKLAPTPDNYQSVYHEVAGTRPLQPFPLERLRALANALPDKTPGQQRLRAQVSKAVSLHSWEDLQKAITHHIELQSASPVNAAAAVQVVEETAFPADLREQMARILDHALPALGEDDPRLLDQAHALIDYLRLPSQEPAALRRMMGDLAFRLSFAAEEQGQIRATLLGLLQLVFEHVGELCPDNPWLQEQMGALMQAAQPPLSTRRLDQLQRQLKDVIHKQGLARAQTVQAQAVLKESLAHFIARLGDMAQNSDHYQQKIERCAEQLNAASDLKDLAPVLQEAVQATRSMAIDSQRTSAELQALRDRSAQAEAELQRLQAELDRVSALACHDMLTGVLNRKGLQEVVQRELSRAQALGSTLCLALLDIDDFKKINDEHGHDTGDQALKHLADVAKAAMRPHDSVARYGGEEFVIAMPDTTLSQAMELIRRLQRELTAHLFMGNEQRLLITFSAGVTEVHEGEASNAALQRADQAMYLAKRSGKNRVVGV